MPISDKLDSVRYTYERAKTKKIQFAKLQKMLHRHKNGSSILEIMRPEEYADMILEIRKAVWYCYFERNQAISQHDQLHMRNSLLLVVWLEKNIKRASLHNTCLN